MEKVRLLRWICVLTLILGLLAGMGFAISCSPSDTKDDADDDDDTDDDDDDDDDDDLPPGITVNPEDGETEVPLTAVVSISSVEPLDPEILDFSLTDGTDTVDGMDQFSDSLDLYFFYPSNLLAQETTYFVNFTFEGVRYTTEFATVEDPGEITIYGNSDAPSGGFYAFEMIPDEIIYPSFLGELILLALDSFDFIIAPVFVESTVQEEATITFAGGEGADFDGDELLEQNHSAIGIHYEGEITGKYISFSGPFQFEYRGATINVDLFFLSGIIGEDQSGDPTISKADLSVVTRDCEGLGQAFPFIAWLFDIICSEDIGLFLYGTVHGDHNTLPDLTFDLTTSAPDALEVTFDPPLYGDGPAVNPLNALFEVYQGQDLILTSSDYLDSIEFPDCCTEIEPGWTSFSKARFNIPVEETLPSGSYTLRFRIGLYGFESDFVL